jgi:hypothetical protein
MENVSPKPITPLIAQVDPPLKNVLTAKISESKNSAAAVKTAILPQAYPAFFPLKKSRGSAPIKGRSHSTANHIFPVISCYPLS